MKVYEAIADYLLKNSNRILFGVSGHGNLKLIYSFSSRGDGEYVAAVNESGAVSMAIGYSEASGLIGLATVTHGPGLTNSITSIVEGVRSHTGFVLLVGEVDGDDLGHIQRIDQEALIAVTGAHVIRLQDENDVSRVMSESFGIAETNKIPVIVILPADLQERECNDRIATSAYSDVEKCSVSEADIMKIVETIITSKYPIILGGRGIANNKWERAIVRLANKIGAPLATTLRGKGLFNGERLNIGIMGTMSSPYALDCISKSDCLINFGASLSDKTMAISSPSRRRIVSILDSEKNINMLAESSVILSDDLGSVAEKILGVIDSHELTLGGYWWDPYDSRNKLLATNDIDSDNEGELQWSEIVEIAEYCIDKSRVLVTDGGRFSHEVWRNFSVNSVEKYIHTMSFGAVGLGLGHAIGATFSEKNCPTVLFIGDGGFLLGGVSELITAVKRKRNLVIIVCNDGVYGPEYLTLYQAGLDTSVVRVDSPNIVETALAFGAEALLVKERGDLFKLRDKLSIKNRRVPLIVDCHLSPNNILN